MRGRAFLLSPDGVVHRRGTFYVYEEEALSYTPRRAWWPVCEQDIFSDDGAWRTWQLRTHRGPATCLACHATEDLMMRGG